MRVAGRVHHPVLGLPDTAGAFYLGERSIYARQVVGMNELPPFLDRRGQRAVPVHGCDPRIAVEATGRKIHAERAQLGASERQLKALVAVLQPLIAGLECRFGPAPLVEQCGQHQRAQRRDEHRNLDSVHALEHGRARIAEATETERGRRDERNGDDERRSRGEHWTVAGRYPQQHREEHRDRHEGDPRRLPA